jgi:hypothetical protein
MIASTLSNDQGRLVPSGRPLLSVQDSLLSAVPTDVRIGFAFPWKLPILILTANLSDWSAEPLCSSLRGSEMFIDLAI